MGPKLLKGIHPVIVLLAIVASLVICFVTLLPRLAGLRRGAPWVPEKPPTEECRVFHPEGFSMIPPPGWVVKTHVGEEKDLFDCSISFSPGSKGYRYAPVISVRTTETTPDLNGFQETNAQNLQIYERTVPTGDGENRCLSYRLITRIDKQWYEVRYHSLQFHDDSLEIPEIMMFYLRSFRSAPTK